VAFFSRHTQDRDRQSRDRAYAKGDWLAVIRYGEEELKHDPENIKLLNDLAHAYYARADYARAFEICKDIYRIHPCTDLAAQSKQLKPRYMRYHEILAEMYFMHGMDRQALEICGRLKALGQLFAKKYSIAAQVYARQGDMDSAAKQYIGMADNCPKHANEALNGLFELARLDPLEEGPFRALYSLYFSRNQLAGIIASNEALCASGRADDDATHILIYMYHFSKEYEKEIELIHRRMAEYPDNADLHVFLARIYQARQEFAKARAHMERATALNPRHAERYRRFQGNMQTGEQTARNKLEAAIRTNVETRQFHKAMRGYEELLDLYPDHPPYRLGMAKVVDAAIGVAVAGENIDEAVVLMDRLALFRNDHPAVEERLAKRNAQLATRRIAHYEALIKQGKQSGDSLNRCRLSLAGLYAQRKDTEHAVQQWQAVAKLGGSGQAEALYQLARHYLQAGQAETAEPYVQQFATNPCGDEKMMACMYELAELCEKAGLKHQARNLFSKLYDVNKQYRDTGRHLESLNRPTKAMEIPEAVMVVDICESSRMMDLYGDEITNQVKNALEEFMFPVFEKHGSKFRKSTGDGFLVTFPNTQHGVDAGISILQGLDAYNAGSPDRPDVHLRFAVHFGAVRIRQDGDRHGTNVNIPFRVEGLKREGLTEAAGSMRPEELPMRDRILITEAAYQGLSQSREGCRFVGLFELRNITGMHKIYLVPVPEEK